MKAATLFMMDARYGMLAHVEHISAFRKGAEFLNFSLAHSCF
jgi:hypothetical protein